MPRASAGEDGEKAAGRARRRRAGRGWTCRESYAPPVLAFVVPRAVGHPLMPTNLRPLGVRRGKAHALAAELARARLLGPLWPAGKRRRTGCDWARARGGAHTARPGEGPSGEATHGYGDDAARGALSLGTTARRRPPRCASSPQPPAALPPPLGLKTSPGGIPGRAAWTYKRAAAKTRPDDVDELGRSRGSQMTSHASIIG